MLKKIFFLTMTLLLIVSTSSGQDVKKTGGIARLAGLGASPYLVDPFFIMVNPAWSGVYNDFILLDIGSSNGAFAPGGSGQYLAGSFSLNENWTVGAVLTRNTFSGFGISLVDPGANNSLGLPLGGGGVVSTLNNNVPGAAVIPMDQNLELMGTLKLGKMILGLGIAIAGTTNDFNPANGESTTNSASQFGINAGILVPLTSKIMLDGGFSFVAPSATYKSPVEGAAESSASQTILLLNARAFWKTSSKFTFVPVLAFMSLSGSGETGGTNSTSVDLPSTSLFSLGIGGNYVVGDFLMTGGMSFTSFSNTVAAVENAAPELATSATVFPIWNFGIEWNFIEWLVARLGYIAVSGSVTTESVATTTEVNEAIASFFLPTNRGATVGLGLRFGDFSLDAVVNEDILRQGFNNIGGGGATFAYISTSYALP